MCRPEPFVVHPNHLSASSAKSGYPAHSGVISAKNVLPAWCASEKNTKQWLQIDLQKNKDLLAVALQGLYDHSWVESFYLQYSSDEETWYCYGSETGHKVLYISPAVIQSFQRYLANICSGEPNYEIYSGLYCIKKLLISFEISPTGRNSIYLFRNHGNSCNL